MIIRDMEAADEAAWHELWSGYLTFYRVDLPQTVTDFTWTRLMDPGTVLKGRLAVAQGEPVGFAIYQHHPSSWVLGDDCYLEDLFVADAARGLGVGRALIDDLRRVAAARGWRRLYWHTDQNNTRARALYDSIVPSDGHVRYRLAL